MSHYERRLAEDLEAVHTAMEEVTEDVVNALAHSVAGIRENSRAKLYDVVLADNAINRKIRRIDALCHAFVARHLPAAGPLRFISSVLRLTIGIERAGDYAATICRVVLQLDKPLEPEIVDRVEQLAESSGSMLRDSVQAFLAGDEQAARDTRVRGISIDRTYDAIFHQLVSQEPRRPALELASLLSIFGRLERVSDQAKNICEETAFAVSGTPKQPKVFRILFLDEKGALLSPLTAAVARKSFPEGGVYSSAGWNPAPKIDEQLLRLADRFGLDAAKSRVAKIKSDLQDYPIDYHLIVGLNLGDEATVPKIPYHTVMQHWDVPVTSGTDEDFDEVVRDLSVRVRELMTRLRGPD